MSKVSSKLGLFGVYSATIFAIVLWGMSYIWSDRLIGLGIPVEYFVFVRIFSAGLFLLLYCLVRGHNISIRKKDIPKFVLLSLFEPFVYFICETYGLKLTESPTATALIIASIPIFSLAVGMVFFKEKVSLLNILGIIICLAGLVLVTLKADSRGPYFWLGVILLIVAIFAEVSYASLTKSLGSSYNPEIITMYQFLIGSIFLFPLFVTKGLANFDAAVYMSWDVWGPILSLSLLCSSIAFSLWVSTISNLGVAKSSIFLAIIPIITALLGFLFGRGNEVITPIQWGGIIISSIGVILSQYVIKSKKQ